MSAGTIDDFSAHVKETHVKALSIEDTSVRTERLRSARCTREVSGGTYFRFTPTVAICYGCRSVVPDPVAATQPMFLARGLFVAFCPECVKTPTI